MSCECRDTNVSRFGSLSVRVSVPWRDARLLPNERNRPSEGIDASARVDAYVSAAWGGALEAMDPEGAPPGSGLTEKQRQAVKDRFTAVNAAVDEASRSGQAEWRLPRPETARALRSATARAVVAAYAAFYRRYKDSGFTRKHPEKYIKHSPEALGETVAGLFSGDALGV